MLRNKLEISANNKSFADILHLRCVMLSPCVCLCVCATIHSICGQGFHAKKPHRIALGRTENNIKMRAFHLNRKFHARIHCFSSLHSGGHIAQIHVHHFCTSNGVDADADAAAAA